MSILDTLVEHKQSVLRSRSAVLPLEAVRERALARSTQGKGSYRPFAQVLAQKDSQKQLKVIGEIKRKSPSKGEIAPDLVPSIWARRYEEAGVCALSVLTTELGFGGSDQDLAQARAACSLPVLRKDFLTTPYEIYESAMLGADAVLLIVRILQPELLSELVELALGLGLEPLVEVYTTNELPQVRDLPARLIGINNRDLGSFSVDKQRAADLFGGLGAHQIPISLSGILGPQDLAPLWKAGITRFLIGEGLSKAADPKAFMSGLLGPSKKPS
jgi:indole-3-glycerol phosphate synthase